MTINSRALANVLFALFLFSGALFSLALQPAQAAITGVSVSPRQGSADLTQGKTFSIRWVISTSPAHSHGAFSAQGQIIDPVTGAVLQSINTPLNRAEGSGPLFFEEVLALTPVQLREWQLKGISAISYQRNFSSTEDDTAIKTTELLITLTGVPDSSQPRAPVAGLFIHKLNLRFENARNRRSFQPGTALRARLDLQYSGAGQIQGTWQITNGNPAGAPIYSTLAIVRKQLEIGRKEYLVSPELPTTEPGQYRIRFCVLPVVPGPEQLQIDGQCPELELMAEATYRVGDESAPAAATIEILSARAMTLSPQTALKWKKFAGARVYQIQIFRSTNSEALEGAEFVLRLLASADQDHLYLSEQARQQLQSGQQYRWRITAHNENAQIVGSSDIAEFTYLP